MTDAVLSLGDIPDLSGVGEGTPFESFSDGWYGGVILAKREFTDKLGNDRVFESDDTPAQKSGRNIRLQLELTRASDKRTMNISTLVNYQPDDLSPETVAAVLERKGTVIEQGDPLLRSSIALQRLAALQKIAGGSALRRNGNGGLDLTPLYGKSGFFRIRPDNRNPLYKEIADFRADAPKKAKVL